MTKLTKTLRRELEREAKLWKRREQAAPAKVCKDAVRKELFIIKRELAKIRVECANLGLNCGKMRLRTQQIEFDVNKVPKAVSTSLAS